MLDTHSTSAQSQRYELARLIIDGFRAVAWPLIVVCLLVIYRSPVGRAVESLADHLAEASKVSLGSLSIEIREKALAIGNSELAEQLGELSPGAIAALLQIPTDPENRISLVGGPENAEERYYVLPSAPERAALQELASKGFIVFENELSTFLSFFDQVTQASDLDGDTIYVPENGVGEEEHARIMNQNYQLTDKGRLGVEAVLKAIESELKPAPSSSAR